MNLLHALLNTVLPVFVLVGLGFLARRRLKVDMREITRVSIYVLSPGLIMHSIVKSQLAAAEVGKILLFGLGLAGAMILLTLVCWRILGWPSAEANAAILGTSFMNSANYVLPVILLAFGQAGFDRAVVFVVLQSLLMFSVAVFFAARGRTDWRGSIAAIFKLPVIWAAFGGLVIRLAGIQLPVFVLTPLAMLANGAIVMVVLLLGMQVASIELKGARLKIGVATLLRLLVSPVVGLALVAVLRPDPVTARVLVLQAAMPTAVNTTLLAVQFEAEPDLVSGVAVVSTLASLATVTLWVWHLQG